MKDKHKQKNSIRFHWLERKAANYVFEACRRSRVIQRSPITAESAIESEMGSRMYKANVSPEKLCSEMLSIKGFHLRRR